MSQASATQKDLYLPEPATVIRNEPMTATENFFEFKLDSGEPLGHMPGQFAEVSIAGIGEAPISISSSPTRPDTFQMVVRRMGNVTNFLHKIPADGKVGIRGPFGTHFPVDDAMRGRDLLFICGGIGLVPVRSAINYVLDNRDDYGEVIILFGAKSPAERLFTDELAALAARKDVNFLETVDRGDASWKGNVGVITTLIPKVSFDTSRTLAIVCGPPIMYKFVLIQLWEQNLPNEQIYVSLERRMKCGLGKCGHCQVNQFYVCQDGPVFKYSSLVNVGEAIA